MSKKKYSHKVILRNSDTVSFDLVVNCLVEICGQNYYQAGQCALIAHHNEQCQVFEGQLDLCQDIYETLSELGLFVELVKNSK